MTHPKHDAPWQNRLTGAVSPDDASAQERRSAARVHVARALATALDSAGVVDKEVAGWTGVKRQVVSQWCRPGGTKNIGVAEASLLRDVPARLELANIVAGDGYRVVRSPAPGRAVAADVATAGLLVRRQATLLEHYLAAHADGHLDPAERRHLRELLAPFIDDLVGLDATLAADELPGERR